MPVYNAETYIAEALDALLSQSFADFEITISDNASDDQTEEICRDYARRDERIRYQRQPENLGAIWNFNHVFEQSRGRYFKWASYDDICLPGFLQKCVDVLDHDGAVAWCHTDSGKIDEQGRVLTADDPKAEMLAHTSQVGLPRRDHQSPQPHRRFEGVLLGTHWCVDSYGVIRSEVLRSTNMLPACYGAEKVLIGELSLRGFYYQVPETLFYQRVHPAASSNIHRAADQLTFMDTRASSRFASTRCKLLLGHLRSVANTPMTIRQRAQSYGVVARYLLQTRKWSAIVRNTLAGTGVGRSREDQTFDATNTPTQSITSTVGKS